MVPIRTKTKSQSNITTFGENHQQKTQLISSISAEGIIHQGITTNSQRLQIVLVINKTLENKRNATLTKN